MAFPQLILPGVRIKENEWNDQTAYIEGVEVGKIAGIRYGVEVELEHLYGAGDSPHSIQSGNRKPMGMLKVYQSTLDAITAAAIAAGGRDACDIEFSVQVTYRGGTGLKRVNIPGIRISKYEYGWDQGAKNMVIELPFLCGEIEYE